MRVLSSSMRTAILRNAQRMVSKVAVRQIERFGAVPEFVQEPVSPHVREQAELIGLPAVAGGAVGARVELHVLDEIFQCARARNRPFRRGLLPGLAGLQWIMLPMRSMDWQKSLNA